MRYCMQDVMLAERLAKVKPSGPAVSPLKGRAEGWHPPMRPYFRHFEMSPADFEREYKNTFKGRASERYRKG